MTTSQAHEDRLAGIAKRWANSGPQRAKATQAAAAGDLAIANSSGKLAARRDRLAAKGLTLEGIVDSDDSLWLGFLSGGLTAARSVGRVVGVQPGQPVQPIGTCCLVADSLVLTNNHVCPDETTAAAMAIEFNYQYLDDGDEQTPDRRQCQPGQFFYTDPTLDFTLVGVATNTDGTPAGQSFGTIPLIPQTGKAVLAEHLNVIHHPGGDRKRVSIRNNLMVAEDDQWIRYQSDTRPGSSGAPVFNDQWEMVALHHGGIRKTDSQGQPLTNTGTPWTPDMGDAALAYTANEGARVSRIVTRIQQAQLTPAQADMARSILHDEEPPP